MSQDTPEVAPLIAKPTTISTGFGTSKYDPSTGNVRYNLSKPLKDFRDLFYGAAGSFTPSAEEKAYAAQVGDYGRNLFGEATSRDLGQMTQDYYRTQQEMLRPDRELESAALADSQYATGRLGYGAGTDGGYLNPQQFALQKARALQDQQLLFSSEDRARGFQQNDIARAMALSDSENTLQMRPYQNISTLFGIGTGIEGLGISLLQPTGQFAQTQASWQQAMQQNQQAMNNAEAADSGGFGGGLLSGIASGGLNAFTGGLASPFTAGLTGAGKNLGGSLFGSLGSWFSPAKNMGSTNAFPGASYA